MAVKIGHKMRMNGAILIGPKLVILQYDTYGIRILERLINLCLFEENVPVGYTPQHLLEGGDPRRGDYAGNETEVSVYCVVVLL